MCPMERRTEEWLRQSDYDMNTAEYLFRGGRHMYAVFMCHLAVEKALKGLYYERLRQIPRKSHSLVFLLGQIGRRPPQDKGRFIVKLSQASILTRYPEDSARIQREYTAPVVGEILFQRQRGNRMDKTAFVDILDRLRCEIEKRGIKPQWVILYGSYATGANAEGSDIDVVIISRDFANKSYWERIDILADSIYEIFAPVEAVAMTPEEWESGDLSVVEFARNGEVLYAA